MPVVTKWISVKFRLPEAGEEVVVLRGGGGAYYARYTGCDGFVQGGGLGFLDVTHWAPIETETEIETGGWIRVEERLPENVAPVIACQAGAENNAYEAIYCGGGGWWQGCAPARPTHWMPYPEPPKREGPFWVKEGYGLHKWAVVHKHNRIHTGMDESEARTLCDRLNKLWAQKENANPLKCPHCKGALRLEQYISYLAIRGTKVCPHCNKVMEIGQRLVKVNG